MSEKSSPYLVPPFFLLYWDAILFIETIGKWYNRKWQSLHIHNTFVFCFFFFAKILFFFNLLKFRLVDLKSSNLILIFFLCFFIFIFHSRPSYFRVIEANTMILWWWFCNCYRIMVNVVASKIVALYRIGQVQITWTLLNLLNCFVSIYI